MPHHEILLLWEKQDAKSPFSGVHSVHNVQETSSLRLHGKQGQFWCSFELWPLQLDASGWSWRDMEPVFSHFPCHGDSFDLTVIRCHNLVTMCETICGETYYIVVDIFKTFFYQIPSQAFVSSFRLELWPQNKEFSKQILEASTRCPRTYLNHSVTQF